jgi:hypothetical protein
MVKLFNVHLRFTYQLPVIQEYIHISRLSLSQLDNQMIGLVTLHLREIFVVYLK